ncbi:MAG: alpha/beta hydrolase-fold protein [Chthoniobacteraceae bacterium]
MTAFSQNPAAAPNSTAAPAGVIKEFTFAESAIFPGTTRKVTVFIPAQYDGSKPACVYVRQDGYNAEEKPLLEKMIAAGEIPVLIGVFVQPGVLKAPVAGQFERRNRCFEYDGVGDRFARFINDEIFPFVAQSCGVKLSADPNDRAISGASSGGISAFNAAWERPDLFRRVYANSGSFVAFRGGNELPTLVRKFEPQPVRAYLTTATHDMENCVGDWFLIDQEMDKALKFSGYDYEFHIVDGKHCAGWIEHFSDAMRFIWKGWPQPVKPGTGAPRVRDVVVDNAPWEPVPGDFQAPRGPACNSKGDIFFVDVKTNRICRIGLDGSLSVFASDAAQASSLFVGPKDELYTVSEATGNVLVYSAEGKASVYASGIKGAYGLALPFGGIYISAPGVSAEAGSTLWYLKDGTKTAIPAPDIKGATGLALRPDHWLLSIGDGRSKWVFSCQVQPDGSLINQERFFGLHVPDWEDDAGAQSVCYALENRLLVATRFGVQICADDGPSQVILPMPDRRRVMGVCLGGPGLNTLYAFCDGKAWKRPVKLHAAGAFTPAVTLKATPL